MGRAEDAGLDGGGRRTLGVLRHGQRPDLERGERARRHRGQIHELADAGGQGRQ